jgi:geranylgeranyl diphosphate synthase type 3
MCEDLTEGKFSFPIIHAIRSDPRNTILLNILKQKTEKEEVKKFAVSYMRERGSFEYARDALRVLDEKAREEIARVDEAGEVHGKGAGLLKILDMMRLEGED